MSLLIIGLTLFLGVHLLREFGLRDPLIARLGNNRYRLLYSLVAAAGLVLLIVGKANAEFVMLWQPSYEFRYITHFFMLPATILVVAGNLPMSHLRRHLQHPMLIGTITWGAAHLWANGDLASLLLFGGFTLWAVVKLVSLVIAGKSPSQSPALLWDVIAVVFGLSLYALLSIYHGQIFGIGLSLA